MMYRPLLLLLLLVAGPARAEPPPCPGYAAIARQTGNASYDPSSLVVTPVSVNLRLFEGDISPACIATPVTLASRNGTIRLMRNGEALEARLVQSAQSGVVTPVSFRLSERATTELVRAGSTNLVLLQIDPGQYVSPGDYLVSLDVNVGDATPRPIDLIVRVEPAMRFVGNNASGGSLSLGEVSDGGEAVDRFFYRANSAFSVTAISDHKGNLVHTMGAQYGAIPYFAYLSDRALRLDAPVMLRLDDDGRRGIRSEELRVVVPPQPNRFAGQYRDTLTLVFTPY
jgi:hypothetical protein